MTSLDDSVICRQNLMLLDNITNYSKPAVDYFHHEFKQNDLEMPVTWSLLLKMRKHKLLRLPNCSIEDDKDYSMYSVRLHHCLWRRWSIEHYKLHSLKVDPLSINWDKEIDITVLYGPDLAGQYENKSAGKENQIEFQKTNLLDDVKNDTTEYQEEDVFAKSYEYSSSLDSNASSIFDERHDICTKTISNSSLKSVKFSETVMRRDIDKSGACHETEIVVNDAKKVLSRKCRFPRKRHHHHHNHHHNSNSHSIHTSDGFHYERPLHLLPDDDDQMLEQNIKSLNLDDETPSNVFDNCTFIRSQTVK
ncbi:hypothetical protein HG535_0F05620 [Zygotorulaspora mrakii]|uniref:Nitrogen regulatory protein areA GATA-like domain-containing protein n=1 Tax=Zygotorulaspora mrakii TaxID=42260 RepID=A0A7H9B686_ZYGMR|nr:uncharacterized protein HG535_0F05620 [Zygotorulaspora mrakii]QLG74050.1 hypothetical protein HG535_0F05620 [Zygotorulaspora mrakii]